MILSVSRILGRAFVKALQEEYAASMNAARARASADKYSSKSDRGSSLSDISLEEAKQILNISNIHNVEEVAKKYDHLFTVNDKKNGGSLYLQSKVGYYSHLNLLDYNSAGCELYAHCAYFHLFILAPVWCIS